MNIYYRYDTKKLCYASGAEIYDMNYYPRFPVQSSVAIDWYFLRLNTTTNVIEAADVSFVFAWSLALDNDFASVTNVMARATNADINSTDAANGHLSAVINTNTVKFISVTNNHDVVTCFGQLKALNNFAEKIEAFKFSIIADGDLDLSVDPPPEDITNHYTKAEDQALLAAKENISNKVTSFQATPDNTRYPSEKLVKDSLDTKMKGDATTADIADSNDKRYVTEAEKIILANTSGTNSGDETTISIGTLINNASIKTTPADNDKVPVWDSISGLLQAVTWSNIKAVLKTYFDTIYLGLHAKADTAGAADTATTANDLNISGLSDESTPSSGMKLVIDNSGIRKKVDWNQLPGISGGEVNTASNIGTAGVGIYKQKVGVDLQFKKINAGSASVTITDDTTNNEVDIDIVDASTSAKGKIECAESSEVTAGTSIVLAVTPNALRGSDYGKRGMIIPLADPNTAVTTGDGKWIVPIPIEFNGWNLVGVAGTLPGAVSTSGTPTYMIRNVTDSVDMLSTAITIDANERTSYTAATAPVVDTAHDDVATGDLIAIDKDAAGTGEKGDTIILVFQKPSA